MADEYTVQHGKLGGKYKEIYKGDSKKWAWKQYHEIKLEPGFQKRLLRNGKKVIHLPCYYT